MSKYVRPWPKTNLPQIAQGQEFANAAKHDGLAYPDLLQRILTLGISRADAAVTA